MLLGISVLTVTACAALQAQSQCMAEKDHPPARRGKFRLRCGSGCEAPCAHAVLREAQNVLSDASDAKQAITAQLPALEAAANADCGGRGCGEAARVSFRRELFPTRDYDTFSLPSGVYPVAARDHRGGRGAQLVVRDLPSLCVPATTDGFADAAAAGGFQTPRSAS